MENANRFPRLEMLTDSTEVVLSIVGKPQTYKMSVSKLKDGLGINDLNLIVDYLLALSNIDRETALKPKKQSTHIGGSKFVK